MTRITHLAAILALLPLTAAAQDTPGAHFITNWDMNADGIVSLDDLTTKRGEVFVMFDANEDGALDATEYALFDDTRVADMANNAGEGHGPDQGRGQAAMLEGMTLAFNDTDGDGAVTLAEFTGHSADWLALIDRDGDGGITAADFDPATH